MDLKTKIERLNYEQEQKVEQFQKERAALEAVLAEFPDAKETGEPDVYEAKSLTLERCNQLYRQVDAGCDHELIYWIQGKIVRMAPGSRPVLARDWLIQAVYAEKVPADLRAQILQLAKAMVRCP